MKLDGRSGGGATVFSHELRPAAESETARQRSPIKTKKKRGRFSLLPSFFSFCSVLFFSTDRVNRRTGSGRRSRGADVRIMFADSRPFLSIRLGLDPTASSRKKKRNEKKEFSEEKQHPFQSRRRRATDGRGHFHFCWMGILVAVGVVAFNLSSFVAFQAELLHFLLGFFGLVLDRSE